MTTARFALHPFISLSLTAAALAVSLPAHALVNSADTTRFSAVGEVGGASGVQIAPNWVLTAAHVAVNVVSHVTSFQSMAGTSVIDAAITFSSEDFPSHDIALLHLSTALDNALPQLNDQVITSGQANKYGTVTLVTAQNQEPNGLGLSTLKSTMNSEYQDGARHIVNWLITQGGASVQGGDSGSALFKGTPADSGGSTLLGVASAAFNASSGSSAYTQVAAYKSWINSTMAASGQSALWASTPTAVLAATSVVPEPATGALFMLFGAAALAHRPTRRKLLG